jgi:hypothetical protein
MLGTQWKHSRKTWGTLKSKKRENLTLLLSVTCSWNGLEQYWLGIYVNHSWDLGNWGSMPATVFQFNSTNGFFCSQWCSQRNHTNGFFVLNDVPKEIPQQLQLMFTSVPYMKRFFINVSKVSSMFKLYFQVILWIDISSKHSFKLFATPHLLGAPL